MAAAENEITIYAKIGNPSGLEQANGFEHQIQVEASLGPAHFCRVRQTTKGSDVKYVYTFKVQNEGGSDGVHSRREHNVDVDESFMTDFKTVANSLQDKTRYFFEAKDLTIVVGEDDHRREIVIPGITFEVDVYKKQDGSLAEWCKIDFEVDKLMTFMEHNYPEQKALNLKLKISSLPIQPVNAFIHDKTIESQNVFVKDLYETQFKTDLQKARTDAQVVGV